jgi:hypothetical protein
MRSLRRLGAALALALALGVFTAGGALAAISPASCQTASGQRPPGQQPTCTGGGLTQQPATNPAGHAPPGQNR